MHRYLFALLALTTAACGSEEPAQWRFGVNITGLRFELYDDTEGIHPSTVVLDNPNNPFRNSPIGEETRWDILEEGGNAGAFYAWATLLARDPQGVFQLYSGVKLMHIYWADEVEAEDLETVRLMAIAAYQSVLDNFPDSVTYDATGTIPYRLATPAYMGIVALGGRPEGGWVLVDTPDGPQAVQGGNDLAPPPAEEGT